MPISDTFSEEEGKYPIETDNAAEMGRLSRQARIATRVCGGFFPQGLDISPIRHVLDLACGPGTWTLDVAQAYPQIQVTGIDISTLMIDYASSIAATEGRPNAHFRVMDATKTFEFPDCSFDLVHSRFITGFMPAAIWPKMLQECKRVLRPQGTLILTEAELPISTSPAFERLSMLLAQVIHQSGQGFSPDGRHLGITPMLHRLLREAGFQQLQQVGHVTDFSIDVELHKDYFYPNHVTMYRLVQPFLVQAGVITQEEVGRLYEQMLEEIQADDFGAVSYTIIAWGKKG